MTAGSLFDEVLSVGESQLVEQIVEDNPPMRRGKKLREDQVKAILADPRRQAVIAREYGVMRSTIAAIKSGETWRYLERPPTHTRLPVRLLMSTEELRGAQKLSDNQVRAILRDYRTAKEIARDYKVSVTLIYHLKQGILRPHLAMENDERIAESERPPDVE